MLVRPVPLKLLDVLEALRALLPLIRCSVGFGEDVEAIRLVSLPRPVTEMVTSSPGLRYTGGSWPKPTPAGCQRVSIPFS